ncbi:dienelactone hydrolase family protein [Vibrio hannami]|uniref:dienelactone hydrolase family protein n=1 Tax=Vibrio hannami TaxID=2717094 RepID=UPI00240FDB8A|nr:dienelactone hydrolase family protein [Vibrio hannami]MDG3088205.1 dienelactone hydrolase family protein [Vibrio hannami]
MKKKLMGLALATMFTSATSIAGENITYQVNGEAYEGYWSKAKDNAPLVLLVHDWDGLTEYEEKRAKMLNDLGYNVFAVDLFGKGIRPTKNEDKRQHTGELYKDRQKLQALMNGGLAQAGKLGGDLDNTVVMGYCFGGAAVLESARAGMDAQGFVSFHGGLKTPEGQSHANTKAPVLILHGTADTAISMADFAQLAVELEENKVPHEMITYSGAPHAFTVFGSPRYREDADKKSWAAFTEFLEVKTQM